MLEAIGPGRRGWQSDFQELMRHRVLDILLVASAYDSFILEEDGHLTERVLADFLDLGLYHPPSITQVSTGGEALELVDSGRRFDLVIASVNLGGMSAGQLSLLLRDRGLMAPVVVLAFHNRELMDFQAKGVPDAVDRVFLWQGDVRILLAIVKYVEDKRNVVFDSGVFGVPVVLVVEDSVRYYSSFLPTIYVELLAHAHALLTEGLNLSHKILRMRARPKLLLASTYEEAWDYFSEYHDSMLGVISDVEFPCRGERNRLAGSNLALRIREVAPDVPIIMQSSRPENENVAKEAGAAFLRKGSPTLLADLRRQLVEYLGFGDFVFRMPDGREVGRASDLRTLEELLACVPAESIVYHGERNHFSKWLRARTEFALAYRLRPRRMTDYPTPEAIRDDLIQSIAAYRRDQAVGVVADFDRGSYDGRPGFHRLGGGSLGGKARGLAFVRRLLGRSAIADRFPHVQIGVPGAVVVGTDVFDQFLDQNNLRDFVMSCEDDELIRSRLRDAVLPHDARADLAVFLAHVKEPLAVRSSSLLEDSQYLPFSGVYETYVLPNSHPSFEVRLERLMQAIKAVYASTFTQAAKAFVRASPYRLEEEKMAVILQRIVGRTHGDRFYPDISGVARSHSFYPTPFHGPEDGVAAVALGLGRTVVDGGDCVRFCPTDPRRGATYGTVADILERSQRRFWALDLAGAASGTEPDAQMREVEFDLSAAEADGTLRAVCSTYSRENDAMYDGAARSGVRLVTFAPVLKHGVFPLAELVSEFLELGKAGMGGHVEIEFAANLGSGDDPHEFGLLQMRPLALQGEGDDLDLGTVEPDRLICRCSNVLGNGRREDIRDLMVVDYHRFDRARSREAALELGRFNARMTAAGRPYVLIGVGRWGSTDPWLGIPVTWDQISGARVIVESGFRDFKVTPSQGAHFFQHLVTFEVGYLTVNPELGDGYVDWDWLASQPATEEGALVRHVRLDNALEIALDGRTRQGIIARPAEG